MSLKFYLCTAVMLFSISGFAQTFPYVKENMDHVFVVRGKILPHLVGRTRVATGTAGLEYRFLQRHSIGTDAIFTWFKTPVYYWDDVMDEQVEGPSKFMSTWDFHVDYRYYLPLEKINRRGIFPYVNLFTKQGFKRTYFEEAYTDSYEKQHDYLERYGFSTGTLWGFGPYKRYGVDVNIGYMYVKNLVHRYDYLPGTTTDFVKYDQDRWTVNFRVNAYYYLFRKPVMNKTD